MLTDQELERYRRQIALFGEEAQERLASARVVIAGAGGLGCPVALYLAAAGVGEIRLVDGDVVDRSNLNRQVLHGERDIGRAKVESAAAKLRAQNPDIRVVATYATVNEGNAAALAGGADLIIDATDNFPARGLTGRRRRSSPAGRHAWHAYSQPLRRRRRSSRWSAPRPESSGLSRQTRQSSTSPAPATSSRIGSLSGTAGPPSWRPCRSSGRRTAARAGSIGARGEEDMQIRVRAFARLREAIGGDLTLEVPGGSTMAGLLAAVGEVSEEAHQALFGENGELQGYVILMHNGRRVRRAEVETLALADGDEVALFPPVAGG